MRCVAEIQGLREAPHANGRVPLHKTETQKLKTNDMKTRISIIIAALFAAFVTTSHAGPPGIGYGGYSGNLGNPIKTEKAAMDCCKEEGVKLALVCKDCKTASEKPGTDKKGIAGWFKADSTHDCSGCGGKITVASAGGGKSKTAEYTHTCSKCGANSALVCSSHKKS